ncbi:MAG TPA: dienelactone hydrolase family protein [Lysobacter sp.]|nr:dienelactone hydrolase family protein [Lysobacter sp.]
MHRAKQPTAKIFVYEDADHAFNRDVDSTHYHATSAALAWRRTLDFLAENLR